MTATTEPLFFKIIVTPNFNMAATMNFVDPFRAANYLEGRMLFRWSFASEHGGICIASNGGSLLTDPLTGGEQQAADFVVISSSWTPDHYGTPAVQAALRTAARANTTIAGIDTGAFVMAQAGLLDGYRATVHYEHIDSFQELYPKVAVSEDLYVFDRTRITCCGGAATIDLSLHIMQLTCGDAITNAAARYIFHPEFRASGTPQNPVGGEPLGAKVPQDVRRAIKLMEENLETPLSVPAICTKVGISHRQLNRLFSTYLRKTPVLYYRDIRLDRARGLVTQTGLSMSEIAVASGFTNPVHFSRSYKDRFDLSPSQDRREGRVPFEFRAWPMHRKTKNKG